MEFFQDPSEIDDRMLNMNNYINSADWEEVKAEIFMFIRVIRNQLSKMQNENFHLLSECKEISDILDIKRHLTVYGAESFAQCLLALYSMKNALFLDQSFDDEEQVKQDLQREVDRLQRYLKESILIISIPEVWASEKLKAGLKKGRKQMKGMISLYACIRDILREKGFDAKHSDICKKLKTYTDYDPYIYGDYELEWDSEAEKLYQTNSKTLKVRSCNMKKVYEYRKKIRKK